jgi:uncharacterized membrane protein YiaA
MPLIGLFLMIVLSYLIGFLGRNRKLGFWGYFFASLVLTPLIGLLLIVATDPIREKDDDKPKRIFKKAKKENIIEDTRTE